MTVHGSAWRTTRSNAGRYVSRSVRSSATTEIRVRSISWLLAAKCFSDAPTPADWRPST